MLRSVLDPYIKSIVVETGFLAWSSWRDHG